MTSNIVADWFGPQFSRLHPQLQALHRHGGQLRGEVELRFGKGLAGVFGRRLARKLGLPLQAGRHALDVVIAHDGRGLHWSRRFSGGRRMDSLFQPVGHWPDGYWRERSGALTLELGVGVEGGRWQWQLRRTRLRGWTLPAWLAPRSSAGKGIESGRYRFHVAFQLPLLGEVLAYEGLLDPVIATTE